MTVDGGLWTVDGPRLTLAVILSQFPRHDEAFLLRELVELAKGSNELAIYSLRPCRDRVIHEQAKRLLPQTIYAPLVWSRAVWRSHGFFLRRSAGAYGESLAWIISRHWRHPIILAKTLMLFPKTVHFARLMQERGVSQMHAGWATFPASAAFIIRRLTGIPYSLSGHAHDIYTANPALAEKMRAARFVLTCTESNRQYLVKRLESATSHQPSAHSTQQTAHNEHSELGTRNSELFVNYHGVDLERFAPAPKPDEDVCRILAVGSLLPCKGFETLIEACKVLKDRGPAFHCTIAGGGRLWRSLERLIARWGLQDQVTMTGTVSQEMVVRCYQHAHLFVLPTVSTIHWGIPNVLIEAMATKTPVICCQLPSLGELIEPGESGWVIPEGDPQALAKAVQSLWADPSRRAQLAHAGYARVVARFSLEKTGERLREIFLRGQEEPVGSRQKAGSTSRQ